MIRAAALAGSAFASLCAAAAQAQTEPQASDVGGIQDIIVTAERRATSLQDTPLSILAVTQETVEAKGVQDLQDLAQITPNLTITPTRGGGNNTANFVIRGIGGGGGATGERGVGLYIDGIYMPRTSGAILRVLDIDRIEVLRGPQGTLFGRNSTGGAIRIFSKQPTDVAEGYVRVTGGNMDRLDVVGMVNMPLGEGVSARVQGAYLSQGGYVSRGTEMLGEQRDIVARGQLKFEPSDRFRATLGVFYNDSHQNGTPYVFDEFDMRPGIEPGPGFAGVQGNYADWINDAFKLAGQAPLAAYNDPRIVKGRYNAPDLCFMDDFDPDYDPACNQFSDDEYWQGDLNMSLDLSDDVSVSSVTGYAKLKHRGLSDYQVLGTENRTENVDSKVWYQELQLNASLGEMFDVVVGGNYFREAAESPNFVVTRRGTSVYPAAANGNRDAGLFRTADISISQVSKSWGVFGSATWHIVDGLNLTGGLRQAWDSKSYSQTRFATPTDFTAAPGTTSTTVASSADFKALDYRATLDYHFTKDAMIYATVSKAYKAGQFSYTVASNVSGAAQSAGIKPIPNEKVVNYEAGLRLTLFNNRLRLNPTAFIMDYTDRQAAVQVQCTTLGIPPAQCPVGFVIQVQNQGDVRLKGLELDGQLSITPELTLDGSFAITDPELRNPPPGTVNLFPDVASPTGTLGASYVRKESFGDVAINVNWSYVGKQSTHPSQGTDSAYTLPSYDLVNARIQFRFDKMPLTLTAFANNVLDRTYSTYAQRFGGGYWDSGAGTGVGAPPRNGLSQVRGRPREVGLTLQYNF